MANENDWGDGVLNNTIVWGQGADNNTIGWGSIYSLSNAGLTEIYGQSYQPEAAAFFTAIEDAGGTLSDNVKSEWNAFVIREKENSRYSKLKRLYPYLGGVINSAIIDAVTLASATNNNFVDADADALVGLQGDGSTKLLRAGYNFVDALNDPISKIQYGTFTNGYNLVGVNNGFAMGTVDTVSGYYYYSLISTSGVFNGYTGLGAASAGQTGITNEVGLFKHSAARYSTTSAYVLVNGVESTQDTDSNASAPSPTREICLFGRNTNGAFGLPFPEEVYMQYISEFDTLQESKDFESSYETFLTNIQAYAAAQAYFAAVEAAGGSLTTATKTSFTNFVQREVDNNRWDKLKRLYPFLGGTIDGAIIDSVTLASATNNNFVDADADSLIGLQGDGTSKYLNTDDVMNSILSENYAWSMGYFVLGDVPTIPSLIRPMGYYRSTGTRGAAYLQVDTTKRPSAFGNWTTVSVGSPSGLLSNSSHVGAKFSNTEFKLMVDGIVRSTNTTADTDVIIDVSLPMFCMQINGVVQSFSPMNNSGYFIAENMTESDLTDFDASYKTFLTDIEIERNGWWNGSQTGLLDSYPSASAAYSVRALNSAYTGALLRVRRSSDNAEQDIHAMADGNLDTTSLLSFVGANDGFVVTWYDQSGSGLDATNSTAAQQRQIVSSGTLLSDNGKPASKDLAATTQYNISTPIYAVDAPAVWSFSVQNADDTLTNTSYLLGANTFNGFLVTTFSTRESVDVRAIRTGGSSNGQMGNSGDLLGQHILTSYADRTTVAAYIDGTLLSGSRADSDTDFVSITSNTLLGTSGSTARSFDGYFQEFILWEVDQSSNQSLIESNINAYYSIY